MIACFLLTCNPLVSFVSLEISALSLVLKIPVTVSVHVNTYLLTGSTNRVVFIHEVISSTVYEVNGKRYSSILF